MGKNTAQFDLASFGRAVRLFADPALQFFWHHRHSGTIDGGVEDRNRARVVLERRQLLLDGSHLRSQVLGDALHLSALDFQPTIGFEFGGGRLKGKARGGAADQAQHPRRVAFPQTQRSIQRHTADLLRGRMIIIT